MLCEQIEDGIYYFLYFGSMCNIWILSALQVFTDPESKIPPSVADFG
jgi:hypothetical protein